MPNALSIAGCMPTTRSEPVDSTILGLECKQGFSFLMVLSKEVATAEAVTAGPPR